MRHLQRDGRRSQEQARRVFRMPFLVPSGMPRAAHRRFADRRPGASLVLLQLLKISGTKRKELTKNSDRKQTERTEEVEFE